MAESFQVSYQNAVARMYALGHELANMPAHKFDLAHMRVLLAGLGSPEQRFPAVLIAGTNGKGSTAATLASILVASGLRTGLYTSPHLVCINERVRIDNQPIGDQEFAELHEEVDRNAERLLGAGKLPWHPSFFEMLTAIAFEHFARQDVDIAVLEVGLGGRLDATNVVEPIVSIITDVSLDHQKYLGDTLAQIATEKAGIIRAKGIVVTLPQQPQVNEVIGTRILELGAHAVSAVPYVPPVSPGSSEYLVPGPALVSRYRVAIGDQEIQVETPLVGRHQLRNVALAIAAAEQLSHQGFSVTARSIEQGIRETRWAGRFQVVPASGSMPECVFDVAHNPAGAWALRATLSSAYPNRPLTYVFGAMRDKAIGEMAEILFPVADHVIVTHAENPRSATPQEIGAAAARTATEVEAAPNVAAALERARALTGQDGIIVVTGSMYIVGEALRALKVRV